MLAYTTKSHVISNQGYKTFHAACGSWADSINSTLPTPILKKIYPRHNLNFALISLNLYFKKPKSKCFYFIIIRHYSSHVSVILCLVLTFLCICPYSSLTSMSLQIFRFCVHIVFPNSTSSFQWLVPSIWVRNIYRKVTEIMELFLKYQDRIVAVK